MDILEFLCILAGLVTISLAVRSWITRRITDDFTKGNKIGWDSSNPIEKMSLARELRKTAEEDRKTAESEQKIAEARAKTAAASAVRHASTRDPGAWILELAGLVGVSIDQIFEDEMPPELARYVPIVRGFIEGGGLQRLLAGAGGVVETSPENSEVWKNWD